jgi:hypothetical protein
MLVRMASAVASPTMNMIEILGSQLRRNTLLSRLNTALKREISIIFL